ncbi:preprotein translocase subunit SecY [Dichelobacter nodosus]|uniref:preprotein translocase subunit SecY n=1 Tax=Dichelobacter nodosus TaxID=870 RepID=UPI000E295D78|nr:preprotein translocase subunit SecY [Dichelobacter nodosus]AXM46014.1 preprotein translocase subunit SecY [Dichelobacter nodosus]
MAKPAANPYKELSSRIRFLVISLIIYRIGVHIPVPGVNLDRIRDMFDSGQGSIFQLFNMFSGGALSNASLLALGVAPYISASIVMQLLTHMLPALKDLRQEGSAGQKKITQYTRYFTLFLAIMQGFAISRTVMAAGMTISAGSGFLLTATIGLTAGALFMMWLGEQITERGIGNGISMLIFGGIAVNMPSGILGLFNQAKIGEIGYGRFFLLLGIIVSLFALIVYVERAQRRIKIHYAKRQQFGTSAMGERFYLPLKINMAGVIPAIFASAIITLLVSGLTLASSLPGAAGRYLSDLAAGFHQGAWLYIATFVLLIILFSFFYTSIMFENRELADSLKKSSAFIQGFRPGRQTADYIDTVQERLTFVGAFYVAFVCVLPSLVNMGSASGQVLFLFGGTSLLIAVVVAMDLMSQIQSHIESKEGYESLMRKANLSGFGGGKYH